MSEAGRVAMLVNNPASHDSRVRREAEALAAAGYLVRVFAAAAPGLAAEEVTAGVTYCRVSLAPPRGPGFLRHLDLGPKTGLRLRLLRALVLGPLGLLLASLGRPGPSTGRPAAASAPGPRGGWPAPVRLAGILYRNSFVFPDLQDAVLAWQPAVVHAHDLAMLPAGFSVARRTGARLIYDAHEFEASRNLGRTALQQWWCDLHERALAHLADGVITVSPGIARRLEKDLALRAPPAVVLNTPASAAIEVGAGTTLRERLGLGPKVRLAVYLGSAKPGRGVDLTLDALAGVPDLHLAIVGPQEPPVARWLADRIGAHDLDARVHLVPPVPAEAVVGFIRDADFGVVPLEPMCTSHRLALPNKLFETLFAGLPVLASDLEEMRRVIVGHDLGAVVDVRDPARFRAALARFTATPPPHLDQPTRTALARTYGWSAQSTTLCALYRDLPSHQPRAAYDR